MDVLEKLLPTLLLIGLGYTLKRIKLFDADFGRTLLKFVFLVATPALALRSISSLHLDISLLAIIVLPVVLIDTSIIALYLWYPMFSRRNSNGN